MNSKKTVSDYMALAEGAPYELIRGNIVEEPSATYGHQSASGDIFVQIRLHLLKTKKGVAVSAPMDVILDKNNAVQPDIIYISNENKNIIRDGRIYGAPDLLIELLSPSNSKQDTEVKKDLYEKFRVREYWIVNPDDGNVMGYENTSTGFKEIFRGKNNFYSPLLGIDIKVRL